MGDILDIEEGAWSGDLRDGKGIAICRMRE